MTYNINSMQRPVRTSINVLLGFMVVFLLVLFYLTNKAAFNWSLSLMWEFLRQMVKGL